MIVRIPWTAEADAHFSSLAGRSCLPLLRTEVIAGVSRLWRCTSSTSHVLVVSRLDTSPRELVICYAEGRGMSEHAHAFIEAARRARAPLRVHTASRAMARWLRRFDLHVSEYVLRGAP